MKAQIIGLKNKYLTIFLTALILLRKPSLSLSDK